MDVIRCKNGHFFDGDLYTACPHCGEAAMPSGGAPAQPVKEEKKGFWGRGRKEKEVAAQPVNRTTAGIPNEESVIGSAPTEVMQANNTGNNGNVPLQKTPTLDFWQTTPTTESSVMEQPVAQPVEQKEEIKAPVENVTPEVKNTIQNEENRIEPPKVEPVVQEAPSSLREAVRNASASNEGKTMSYFSSAVGPTSNQAQTRQVTEPVVGWLVCISGCYFGECFKIFAGKNSIGRSEENRIVIANDNSISRNKHALLVYEPKKRNFYLQPGDSSGLTYLNDDYITESQKMKARDIVELGESKFMFVPLCGEDFSWEDHMPKGE